VRGAGLDRRDGRRPGPQAGPPRRAVGGGRGRAAARSAAAGRDRYRRGGDQPVGRHARRPRGGPHVTFLYGVYVAGCLFLLVAGSRATRATTRLRAGALGGRGMRVVAKTTGTAARFSLPDGTEEPVHRKFGIANVAEQIGIVRRAASWAPHALVVECMAVLPDLQEINEKKLIRSTICVICNVREDHLDEMGPTLDDVARSLARSMPEGGICVTAERKRLHILQEEADRRG